MYVPRISRNYSLGAYESYESREFKEKASKRKRDAERDEARRLLKQLINLLHNGKNPDVVMRKINQNSWLKDISGLKRNGNNIGYLKKLAKSF